MAQIIGGRYQFDRTTDEIGVGGMGSVYKALDLETEQFVAIKQLKPEITDNVNFVERFEREAEALRRLNHPSIVNVLNTFREDANHYIVMEYVSGGTLGDMLEQSTGGLTIERTLEIALDLADALTRAHRVGIIHRDIKPANVLIAEDGTPRLTDFGVAQISDKTRVTQTGSVVGTLNYLSPEALNGLPLDERTDIWAFGVMLFEMLTGERPFDEDTTTGLITAILTKPTPDVHALRSDVPPTLVDLISQMLMKDTEDRLNSVRKVGTALEDLIRGADSNEIEIHDKLADAVPTDPKQSRFARATSEPSASGMGLQRVVSDTGEEYMMMPARSARNLRLVVATVVIALALTVVGLVVLLDDTQDSPPDGPPPNGPDTREPPPETNNRDQFIDPIEDDEYMVLIVPFDNLGTGEDYDVQRFITADLVEKFEQSIPFSNVKIRSVPQVPDNIDVGTGSRAFANAMMDIISPSVVVWGTYDEERIVVNIQIGDTGVLPYNQFEDSLIARTANIEIEMTDAREQTLAPYVAGVLGVMHSADGDVFELMRVMTMLQDLPAPSLEAINDSPSAYVSIFFANYLEDPQTAVDAMDIALDRDGGNPLLYSYRAFAYLRTRQITLMADDLATAERIGPDGWIFPAFLATLTPFTESEAILNMNPDDFTEILAARPDDWFLLFSAAEAAYSTNDLETAQYYVDQALANDPEMNVAHMVGVLIALHEGRLNDAGELLGEMVQRYPDPNFSTRVIYAVLGEDLANAAAIYSAFSNLFVGQYQRVLEDTTALFQLVPRFDREFIGNIGRSSPGTVYLTDLLMARGIAMCANDNLDAALNIYTIATTLDPDFSLVYLLMGDAAVRLGRTEESITYTDRARGKSNDLDSFIDAALSNPDITCTSFFDDFTDGWEVE